MGQGRGSGGGRGIGMRTGINREASLGVDGDLELGRFWESMGVILAEIPTSEGFDMWDRRISTHPQNFNAKMCPAYKKYSSKMEQRFR